MNFKTVKPFPNYEVSECGIVRARETKKVMQSSVKKDGYVHINLRNPLGVRKTLLLHRVVYRTWKGEIGSLVIGHKDNNRGNCHANNLQAITQKENIDKKFADMGCPKVVDPKGNVVQVTRPEVDFCKERGLTHTNFNSMLRGKRNTCQGWRLA